MPSSQVYGTLSYPFRSSLLSRLVLRDLPYCPFLIRTYRFVLTMPPAFDKYVLAECLRSFARCETTRKDQAAANKIFMQAIEAKKRKLTMHQKKLEITINIPIHYILHHTCFFRTRVKVPSLILCRKLAIFLHQSRAWKDMSEVFV